jgi:AraC-like DNA-binding protein
MRDRADSSIEIPRNNYWERPPVHGLERHVTRVWASRVAGGSPFVKRVVPDGCADIIWLHGSLIVAGPDTGPVLTPLNPGSPVVGVRFRPGLAPTVLGVAAAELLDARVDLEALWGRAAGWLEERLAGAPTAAEAMALLERELIARLPAAHPPDPLAETVLAELRRAPRFAVVSRIAATVGTSERQLHRRCLAAFGYGPKTLDRILRFQRFLTLAGQPDRGRPAGRGAAQGRQVHQVHQVRDLARLAVEAGYADQAHLSRECRTLGGLSPRLLLAS